MSPAPKRGEWNPGAVGAPTGAVHLSYFIRDRLYPGIRDKKTDEGVSTFAYRKAKYPAFCRRWALSAGREKIKIYFSTIILPFEYKDPIFSPSDSA